MKRLIRAGCAIGAMTLASAMWTGVGAAEPLPSEVAEPHALPGAVGFYYGTTETGEFFQTIPLNSEDPRNRNVARPDRDLPLDPAAQGSVIEVDRSKRDGNLFATCWVTVNPVGFNLSIRQMYATTEQYCTTDVYQHWVYSRFDRTSPNGWVEYNYAHISGRSVNEAWYEFLYTEGCSVGAGAFDYRQNATGQAETDDGRIITGAPTVSAGTPGNCGNGVTP